MPKCSTEEIKREITALLTLGGYSCAVYYLKAELERRKRSKDNTGRKAKFDDPRHKQMREASARYRKKKLEEMLRNVEAENLQHYERDEYSQD